MTLRTRQIGVRAARKREERAVVERRIDGTVGLVAEPADHEPAVLWTVTGDAGRTAPVREHAGRVALRTRQLGVRTARKREEDAVVEPALHGAVRLMARRAAHEATVLRTVAGDARATTNLREAIVGMAAVARKCRMGATTPREDRVVVEQRGDEPCWRVALRAVRQTAVMRSMA